MKICVVTSFPPEKANLAEYGYYLVEELAKKGKIDEIIVLANGKSSKLDLSEKVKIVRCWKNDDTLSLLGIIRNIRLHDPDLIFFNCHMMSWGKGKIVNFFGASLPTLLKKLFGYKIVLTLHNIAEAVNFEQLRDKPSKLDLFGARIATKSMLNADKVIVTLKRYVSLLKKKYKKANIVHVPHGTFGRKDVKISPNEKRILTFGFWRDTKGLPILLDSFKELRTEDSKLELVVAGKSHPNFPGYLEEIKRKYKIPNVSYIGYVPEEKLADVFGSASIVVLPYVATTGSSGVVHLSASYGRPVLIADMLDIRRLTEEEGLELALFPKGDKEGLKKAIRDLLTDKKKREKIVKNNLRVAEKLSFSKITDRYVDVFEKVLAM